LGEVEDDGQSRRSEEGPRRRAGELTARVSAGCTMNTGTGAGLMLKKKPEAASGEEDDEGDGRLS